MTWSNTYAYSTLHLGCPQAQSPLRDIFHHSLDKVPAHWESIRMPLTIYSHITRVSEVEGMCTFYIRLLSIYLPHTCVPLLPTSFPSLRTPRWKTTMRYMYI